jgi:hypothetical protein
MTSTAIDTSAYSYFWWTIWSKALNGEKSLGCPRDFRVTKGKIRVN